MATTAEEPWQAALTYLVDHGGSIEATPLDAGQEPPGPGFRARLLAFDRQQLVIEKPQQPEVPDHWQRGEGFHVLAAHEGQRWQAIATIVRPLPFELNPRVTVDAVELATPGEMQSAQRRAFSRVSTGGLELEPVVLMPSTELPFIDDQDEALKAKREKWFCAEIVNVGGGGIGVIAPQSAQQQVELPPHFRCQFLLPNADQPLDVRMRVVRSYPVGSGSIYLGLKLEDEMQNRLFETEICRFTAWQQRVKLRRRRA